MKPTHIYVVPSGLSGYSTSTLRVPCALCNGKGKVVKTIYSSVVGPVDRPFKCTECQGHGYKEYEKLEYPPGQQARNAERWSIE